MANPKIEVELTADAKGLKKGLGEAGSEIDKVSKKVDDVDKKGKGSGGFLSGFGDQAGDVAKNKLGPLGDAVDDLGFDLDKMSAPVAAAGAAIAGVGAFAAQGVSKFVDLAGSVRKVHDASGLSFESSSKLVAVSDDLGISAETVASSMGRLAKNIDTGKLAEFGIEIVKAKDGTVDMEATLGRVADKMNATVDPTQKAAMGTALFGKSWADLQPVLQQGSAGLREAMAEVSKGQIVTEENADAAREWEMALDDAQDAISELQMAMAKDMLPQLAMMLGDFAKATGAVNDLTSKFGGLSGVLAHANPLTSLYAFRLRDQKEAAEDAAAATDAVATSFAEAGVQAAITAAKTGDVSQAEQDAATKADILRARQQDLAQAHKDAAAAAAEQKSRLEELNGLVTTIVGTQLAYESAVAATTQSTDSLAQRQLELTEAVNLYGPESDEAWEATKNYEDGLRSAKGAADAQAQAAANLAEKTALASGATFTAEQKNIVYRDSLAQVAAASNDPNLQSGLGALIGLTDDTARAAGNAAQQFYAMEAAASRAALVAAGATTANRGFTGSADSAERTIENQSLGGGGYANQLLAPQGPIIGSAAVPTAWRHTVGQDALGPAPGTTIVINTPIGRPADVVNWVADELRRQQRGQR